MFNIELLQAISDWQQGGNLVQKAKRGLALKKAAECLPEKFRVIHTNCYRKMALDSNAVWNIGTKYQLDETISSWTISLDVAKQFKGGVPSRGSQGVIFQIMPTDDVEIIVNLHELFCCQEFIDFLDTNKNQIEGYQQGIGKYSNSQCEVVISAEYIALSTLIAWGGYTSPEFDLAKLYFNHEPSEAELEYFRLLMKESNLECGKYWLTTANAVSRISEKLKTHAERLSKVKAQRDSTE
ncbi:hypothetical protein ACUU3R_001080 [Providencia rettgeri]|nr:hypothetical protein [Providencia rettgeri]